MPPRNTTLSSSQNTLPNDVNNSNCTDQSELTSNTNSSPNTINSGTNGHKRGKKRKASESPSDESVTRKKSNRTGNNASPSSNTGSPDSSENVRMTNEERGWENFQRKHLLDPTIAFGMNRAQWNVWLEETLRPETNPRQQFGGKQVNTVIAYAPPEGVLQNFRNSTNRLGSSGNYIWTSQPVRTFDLRRSSTMNGYRVYDCGIRHIAVGMAGGYPVHLHRHSVNRQSSGNVHSTVSNCPEVL